MKDLLRVVRAYGDPLIRTDRNGSIAAVWQTEHGRIASLSDAQGRAFEPTFRLRGEDRNAIVSLGVGPDGLPADGKWQDGRSILTTPRHALPRWSHEAENDLRDELQAALDAAHERQDFVWHWEIPAPPQQRSHFGELVYAGLNISERPEDRDRSLPPLTPEQEAEIRRQRIAAGLDKPAPTRVYAPGYGP